MVIWLDGGFVMNSVEYFIEDNGWVFEYCFFFWDVFGGIDSLFVFCEVYFDGIVCC